MADVHVGPVAQRVDGIEPPTEEGRETFPPAVETAERVYEMSAFPLKNSALATALKREHILNGWPNEVVAAMVAAQAVIATDQDTKYTVTATVTENNSRIVVECVNTHEQAEVI